MKSTFTILVLCSNLVFAAEIDDSSAFYRRTNQRAWNYAERLMKIAQDPEREILERDLASDAFTYWLMRVGEKTPQNHGFERTIKKVFVEQKLIRESVANDPLGRATNNRRGASIYGVIIRDVDYPRQVQEFQKFISEVEVK